MTDIQTETKFKKSDLKYWLKPFNGLTKKYMMECIFDKELQASWKPKVGDLMCGPTGNIFPIAGKHHLHESLGGPVFFYAPTLCNRDGGNIMNSTHCSLMNETGFRPDAPFDWDVYTVSKFSDYRWIPYPHEHSALK